MSQEGKHFYEFGPFRIDTEQRLLMRNGEVVPLAPKAVETLLALLANSGRVMEKDELIKIVWPDTFVEEGGLARNISVLRKALGDEAEGGKYIKTITRRGYQFVATVKESSEPFPAPAPDPDPPIPPPPRPSWLIPALIASALASAIIIWWITRPPKPSLGMTSLVVLPLENRSSEEAQDYFADGMTDAVLTRLAKIRALKVVSYSGGKGPREAAAVISRRLHVDAAIEGSVISSGDRVRINVRLIQAGSGQHLWAEEYEGDLRNVLAIQGEVAKAIAHEIQVKATPQEEVRLTKSHPVDPEAYLAFLKGRYYASRRSGEGLLKSLDYFQQAIQKDPSYALAYSGLADAYALLGSSGYDVFPPLEAQAKAAALVAQALKLDDTLPEAHTSLGYLKLSYDWDFPAAEKEFLRAIDLNPGYPTAHHWYAHYLLAQGQMEPALAEMKRAQELEPLSLILNTGVGWCLYYARRYDEAIAQFGNVFQMEPSFVPAQFALAMTYMQKGSTREAIAEWQKLNTAYAGRVPLPLAGLGVAQANAGNRREAQNALNQLQAMKAQRYVPALYPALIYSALHDDKQALNWAPKALAERPEYLIYLRVEPAFERLRADPQFQSLARRAGLEP
jgi:TolB-like protein/DNA-binding winged helix-turn-helix (wHTH) protein/Tfp pilus assembly protein PilF